MTDVSVVLIGNSLAVTMRSHPPGKVSGSIFDRLNLCADCEFSGPSEMFPSSGFWGIFPGMMYSSFLGRLATVAGSRFRLRATRLGGVRATQSVMLKVPN